MLDAVKTIEALGQRADGGSQRRLTPHGDRPAHGSPHAVVVLSQPMFTSLASRMETANVMWGDVVKGPPISQKGVQRPTTGSLDYVRWSASDKQFGCAANPEAVASGTRVPYLVTTT